MPTIHSFGAATGVQGEHGGRLWSRGHADGQEELTHEKSLAVHLSAARQREPRESAAAGEGAHSLASQTENMCQATCRAMIDLMAAAASVLSVTTDRRVTKGLQM